MPRGYTAKPLPPSKNDKAAKSSSASISIATAHAGFRFKGKTVSFKVLIRFTGEKFNVNDCPVNLKIKDLKGFLEFICGIPFNAQKLCYLDEGFIKDMPDFNFSIEFFYSFEKKR